jgi:hypothetical protein
VTRSAALGPAATFSVTFRYSRVSKECFWTKQPTWFRLR